jgi:fatty acid desaturase
MASGTAFVTREKLAQYEWDRERKEWRRPPVDRETMKRLSERSTANGLLRVGWLVLLLTGAAVATVAVARANLWLAIPVLYVYYFIYGFWVAIAHELQHRTVFGERADRFSEVFFSFVQTLVWNSPTYARVSHRLHHRYTMVRGTDPETAWPELITSGWLRRYLLGLVAKILVVGAVVDLGRSVWTQVERAAGRKSLMMREHCTEREVAAIRRESLAILLAHAAVAAAAIVFRRWELLAFVTLAWQIGSPIESLWHSTEHIGRPYDVNDHRLNTRSIRVSWFIKLIFWGLDDHVDHHLYPIVPSRNLPRLHRLLEKDLPRPNNVFGCWAEMFATAREKDRNPKLEFLSVGVEERESGAP